MKAFESRVIGLRRPSSVLLEGFEDESKTRPREILTVIRRLIWTDQEILFFEFIGAVLMGGYCVFLGHASEI